MEHRKGTFDEPTYHFNKLKAKRKVKGQPIPKGDCETLVGTQLGIITEILALLNRSQQRARQKAQTSTQNKGAWLEQVNDLATLRRLLQEMNHFLKGAEQAADNRYAQAQEDELLDREHASDLDAAKKLADDRMLFEDNDVGTIKGLLMRFKADAFGEAWRRLPVERRKELEAAKKRKSAG